MAIGKIAGNPSGYARPLIPFRSARAAFQAILSNLETSTGKVLLPAFIGWSSREGSGVFDPIASLDLDYSFYALDERLHIDLDSLRAALQIDSVRVLVIIHYFGYVDPSYVAAVKIAREHGVFVLEDEAHAMLSDRVGGICGRLGDACIYSFHKLLPVESGGAAVINNSHSDIVQRLVACPNVESRWSDFDLHSIAARRTANSLLVDRLIREFAPSVEPLWGPPRAGEVPQTYPVLVPNGARDFLYHEMNAAGFGVVSLYHTLISQIEFERYPHGHNISRGILNLPVHQDATETALEMMVCELARLLRTHGGPA